MEKHSSFSEETYKVFVFKSSSSVRKQKKKSRKNSLSVFTVVVADVTGRKSCTEGFGGLFVMMA